MVFKNTDFKHALNRFLFTEAFRYVSTAAAAIHVPVQGRSQPSIDFRMKLLLNVCEECQTEKEMHDLLNVKPSFICYDGFEPSGRMHVAQGIFKAINVNRCIEAGGTFVFWVADWFALMNDKMGGELELIRLVGRYFIEVWKASGMKMEKVIFKWASKEINKRPAVYWKSVIDISKRTSLSRVIKCCQIMGRKEGKLSAAQILYPLMQCADIFFLNADICQLGLDQRKVNMLAREICDHIGVKRKPVILSHHMIRGLKDIREDDGSLRKMSKSDPDSAIFMEDAPEDVERKIAQAYCPRGNDIESNPCLDYVKNIVFAKDSSFMGFHSFEDVRDNFQKGTITEGQLKIELANRLNTYIEPVRKHFIANTSARDILTRVHELAGRPMKSHTTDADVQVPHTAAWLYPSFKLNLFEIVYMVNALNARVRSGIKTTVIFADWSASAVNCEIMNKESTADASFAFTMNVLRSFGLDRRVEVLKQSTIILQNADDYWLRVIETGREIPLASLEKKWASKGLNLSGQVITALMHIVDIACIQATSIITYGRCIHLACPSEAFVSYINDFLKQRRRTSVDIQRMEAPEAEIFCHDPPATVQKKVKKLFAPEKDTEKNMLLSVTSFIFKEFAGKDIRVGGPENSQVYGSMSTLICDYRIGKIHPGDLKASVARNLVDHVSTFHKNLMEQIHENAIVMNAMKRLRLL